MRCRWRSCRCGVGQGWRLATLAVLAVLVGCTGSPIASERAARADLELVAAQYRPGDAKPELPTLSEESDLAEYLRFAMLNNPKVEAAYYDWAASIEGITTARSSPDPRLTFEMDITNAVERVMPGLMTDLPGPGKLLAAGNVAARGSEGRYAAFEAEVLRTAFAVKSTYYRLRLLEENIRVERENLAVLGELEQSAQQQNAAGRATLQDVLRAQIEQERLKTQVENLQDSRSALVAELKGALGLGPQDPDPAVPVRFVSSEDAPDYEVILETALERNPTLRQLEADIRRAQAAVDLAAKTAVPDFTAGLESDLRVNPVMWRPSASMTLPIWRDKVAAAIAGAQADQRAAEARLTSEQVQLVTELASVLYTYRQSVRNAKVLEEQLIPKGQQALQAARIGYATGKSSFLDVLDSYRQLLGFGLALTEARTERELALASVSLLVAGVPPAGSPTLAPVELSIAPGAKEVSQ